MIRSVRIAVVILVCLVTVCGANAIPRRRESPRIGRILRRPVQDVRTDSLSGSRAIRLRNRVLQNNESTNSTVDQTPSRTEHAGYAQAITAVLARDKEIGDWIKEQSKEGVLASTVFQGCLDKIRMIDLSQCPPDFRRAYSKHIEAWSENARLVREYEARGWEIQLGDSDPGSHNDPADVDAINESNHDTFHEVQAVALKYGVEQKQ
jgi:hypothetical protein